MQPKLRPLMFEESRKTNFWWRGPGPSVAVPNPFCLFLAPGHVRLNINTDVYVTQIPHSQWNRPWNYSLWWKAGSLAPNFDVQENGFPMQINITSFLGSSTNPKNEITLFLVGGDSPDTGDGHLQCETSETPGSPVRSTQVKEFTVEMKDVPDNQDECRVRFYYDGTRNGYTSNIKGYYGYNTNCNFCWKSASPANSCGSVTVSLPFSAMVQWSRFQDMNCETLTKDMRGDFYMRGFRFEAVDYNEKYGYSTRLKVTCTYMGKDKRSDGLWVPATSYPDRSRNDPGRGYLRPYDLNEGTWNSYNGVTMRSGHVLVRRKERDFAMKGMRVVWGDGGKFDAEPIPPGNLENKGLRFEFNYANPTAQIGETSTLCSARALFPNCNPARGDRGSFELLSTGCLYAHFLTHQFSSQLFDWQLGLTRFLPPSCRWTCFSCTRLFY